MTLAAERETRFEKFANSREDSIRKRQAEAQDHKKKTLEMYDQMAKSSPAGAPKVMNVNLLRGSQNNQSFDSDSFSRCSSISETGLLTSGNQRDLVEEAIQDRQKAANDEKKRILAAYDAAAKAGPAGTYRVADLKGFKKEDAANFQPPKPTGACTFGASGGIPIVSKGKRAPCCSRDLIVISRQWEQCRQCDRSHRLPRRRPARVRS